MTRELAPFPKRAGYRITDERLAEMEVKEIHRLRPDVLAFIAIAERSLRALEFVGRYDAPPPPIPAGMAQCTRCDKIKALRLFGKDTRKRNRHKSICAACHSERERRRYHLQKFNHWRM